MDKLRECPFCNVVPITPIQKTLMGYRGWCLNCGTEGPARLTADSAIEKWNTRADDHYREESEEVVRDLLRVMRGEGYVLQNSIEWDSALASADKFLNKE
jgi:hypothetical protein